MMAKPSKQPSNRPKENRRTRQKILHQIAQIEEPGVFAGQIACCKEQNKHQTDHRHHKAGNSRNLLAQNLHLIFSFRMHSVVSPDTIFSLPYFCRFIPFPNGVKQSVSFIPPRHLPTSSSCLGNRTVHRKATKNALRDGFPCEGHFLSISKRPPLIPSGF